MPGPSDVDRRFFDLHDSRRKRFDKLVLHEAGGHGFAKLCSTNTFITRPRFRRKPERNQSFKTSDSISMRTFRPTSLRLTWQDFARGLIIRWSEPIPGGHLPFGIWRPEENSCMNDNVAYFNARSRWAQIRRIRDSPASRYTFDAFPLRRSAPGLSGRNALGESGICPASCRRGLPWSSRSRRTVERRSSLFERTDVGEKNRIF